MATGATITIEQINQVRIYYGGLVNDPDPVIATNAQNLIDKCDQGVAGSSKAKTVVAQAWNSLVDQGLIIP
jgi:hypothetical protein